MKIPVGIRPATTTDAGALAEVFVQAWRAGYRGVVADDIIDALSVQEWTTSFQGRLRTGGLRSILSEEGTTVTGFARFGVDPRSPSPTSGYLASLYVRPAAAGRGIGAALLGVVLEELSEAGRTDVGLWVFTANTRARRLYERYGFRATGEATVDPEWGAEQIRYRRCSRI